MVRAVFFKKNAIFVCGDSTTAVVRVLYLILNLVAQSYGPRRELNKFSTGIRIGDPGEPMGQPF
eukprot:SAG31_NODE_7074_length_1795_cov_50.558962_2_plen_64_part_00